MPSRLHDLLGLAESEEWQERAAAVEQLGRRPEQEAHGAVVRALYDPEDTAVTEAAVEALVARADGSARQALLAALESEDDETAEHVGLFLERHAENGSPFARSVLANL